MKQKNYTVTIDVTENSLTTSDNADIRKQFCVTAAVPQDLEQALEKAIPEIVKAVVALQGES